MNMDLLIRTQARLIILKALAAQTDETLNSDLLVFELQPFGIRKDRAWVHEELSYLKDMDAVTLLEAGTIKVATLTHKGHRHLDRQIQIEGVQRPSRPGA